MAFHAPSFLENHELNNGTASNSQRGIGSAKRKQT